MASAAWEVWALLPIYGLYMGMTDGATRAYAADLAPPEARGTALGWIHMVGGVGALVASVVAGALWTSVGPAALFLYGAVLAAAAVALLLVVSPDATAVPIKR